jgi:hypothetical protein
MTFALQGEESTDIIFSNTGGTTGKGVGGQIKFQPFSGSGQLEYRFGPYESWHQRQSHSIAFHPIPHSGQILQMILEHGDLQDAYDNGPNVFLTRDGQDHLDIVAVDGTTRFSTNGTYSELSLSGQLDTSPALENMETGDMNGYVHSLEPRSGGSLPASLELARARALGIGHPTYNTGSGVANVRLGSGISQFFNVPTQTMETARVPIQFNGPGNIVRDSHFIRVASNSGIKVTAPGLYRIQYAASFEKTAGTTPQTVNCDIAIAKDDFPIGVIPGSFSSAMLFDATNNDTNTANGMCLVDLYPGDIVALVAELTASPGGNTVRAKSRANTIIIEYIGPRRS